jgi:hypothetical protein
MNETSATIMASSLPVVVGDRGHGHYNPQAAWTSSLAGDPVGSRGAPLGWRGTWAAKDQIGSGGGATFLSDEKASRPRSPTAGIGYMVAAVIVVDGLATIVLLLRASPG